MVELRLTLLVSEAGLIDTSRGGAANDNTRWVDRRRRDMENMMIESRSYCFEYMEKKKGGAKTLDSHIVQGQDVDLSRLERIDESVRSWKGLMRHGDFSH